MNQFETRTGVSGIEPLRAALGSTIVYTALDGGGSVLSGYPATLNAIVRHETTMRTYEGDGDIVTETLKVAVRTDQVTPRIGDYLSIDGNDYSVTDIDIRGAGLTTVTAERTRNARIGAQQGFVR